MKEQGDAGSTALFAVGDAVLARRVAEVLPSAVAPMSGTDAYRTELGQVTQLQRCNHI
jgi:hypothetical protein